MIITTPLIQKSTVRYFLVWLLLFGLGGVLRAEDTTISLRYDQLNDFIREKNEYVQSSALSIASAKERTHFFQRSFSPQLSASLGSDAFYNQGMEDARFQPVANIGLSLNLSRGGQDKQEEAIRKAEVGLAEAQRDRIYATELAIAQGLYWDIAHADEMIRNARDILVFNSKNYASAKRRFNRGLLTPSDLQGFDIYKGQLQETIESFEHEKKILVIKLKGVLGLSEHITLVIPPQILPHTHDDPLLKEVLSAQFTPEIRELRLNESVLVFQRNKLLGKTAPSIDLFGAYTLYTEEDRPFSNVMDRAEVAAGIRAHFLIFDGNQTRAEIESSALKLKAHSRFSTYKNHLMTSDLKVYQEELIHLHELLHHSEDRLTQTKRFLENVTEEYDRGVKNSTDVLTTIQLYEDVQEKYLTQKKDYQKTKSALLALLGSPLK
jgi:outer membrane protein TolC